MEKETRLDRREEPLLTETELRVLELAKQGLTLVIIGKRMFGDNHSVYRCKKKIFSKLEVSDWNGAANKAEEIGILPRTQNAPHARSWVRGLPKKN